MNDETKSNIQATLVSGLLLVAGIFAVRAIFFGNKKTLNGTAKKRKK